MQTHSRSALPHNSGLRRAIAELEQMSAAPSPDLQRSVGPTGLRSSEDALDTRASAERLDEVIMSESTGTVGLIFIEQKDGIVVLMCVRLPPHIPSSCIFICVVSKYRIASDVLMNMPSSVAGACIRAARKKMAG